MMTRRSLLKTLGGSATLVVAPAIVGIGAASGRWNGADPFSLGVASGSPTPDGFVIWTRLAPDPLCTDPAAPGGLSRGNISVAYEIAADPSFRTIVQSGLATAESAFAHSVHVEVRGLAPARHYWYRFVSYGVLSAVGRAVTTATPESRCERLRFGFVSCSHYEEGYFSAYRHLADELPDIVLFLGDYIYEYSHGGGAIRRHSDGGEAATLAGYRNRYAQYRTDPDLQRLHAIAPALVIWDDHEVQNDYADRWSQSFDDPEDFLTRRAAAYQAFYEHMPLRPSQCRLQGASLRLHGRTTFGDLVEFSLLDGRKYRSREACYFPPDNGGGHTVVEADCPDLRDPSRTMLGMPQEAWLYRGFRASRARWNVLGQAMMMAELRERLPDGRFGVSSEDWNGYPAARVRLLQQMQQSRVANPVVVGGDMHSFWASDLKLDFGDPASPVIATEFIGTSVSSSVPPRDSYVRLLPDNPHVRYFDSGRNGYAAADVTAEAMAVRLRAVTDVTRPDASVSTLASFAIEAGRAGVVGA